MAKLNSIFCACDFAHCKDWLVKMTLIVPFLIFILQIVVFALGLAYEAVKFWRQCLMAKEINREEAGSIMEVPLI